MIIETARQWHGARPGDPLPLRGFRLGEQGEVSPAISFSVDLRVSCRDCREPFVWVGPMPIGQSPGEPRVSVDGTELRAPIRPASADGAFGLNVPGFGVRFREGL